MSANTQRLSPHRPVELITWLHAHGMTLRDLRQEQLDRWLAGGPTTRRRIRAFLAWARRAGLLPALDARRAEPRRHTDPLDADQRLRLVGALLADHSLDLRERVAGCLLLVFAQPISRLAHLTVDDVDEDAHRVRQHLGPEPLELSEPLGALVAELKQQRPGLATTAAGDGGRWLFPGLRLDAPLHSEHLRRRLRQLGITARPGRAAASYTSPRRSRRRSSPTCSASQKAAPPTGPARPPATGRATPPTPPDG